MTGEELKQYIKDSGLSVSEIARELDMTPQNITAKFGRQTVKRDFLAKVEAIINKCCPPLPGEMDAAVFGNSVVNGSNSPNVNQTLGGTPHNAALQRENELLRQQVALLQQQNEFLQKQTERLMAIVENK